MELGCGSVSASSISATSAISTITATITPIVSVVCTCVMVAAVTMMIYVSIVASHMSIVHAAFLLFHGARRAALFSHPSIVIIKIVRAVLAAHAIGDGRDYKNKGKARERA